ncbi:MAG: glycosyltransferase family 2 protein [Candidatus Aminicenantes bacterium]|nr:glycosyltransferase family 2 protein [Candidatus Aminicenantes bacterium]
MSDVDISVVIPVYNSEDCLDELARKLTSVLDKLGSTYEIILVNDCSLDNSWEKIVELCEIYGKFKGISLRKNSGQDNAIMAGLNYSSGASVIIMDDDLQQDPADIPSLLGRLEEGYDGCYARPSSKKHSWFKNFGSWFNDKVANVVLKKPKEIYLSPYKALKREVVDEIIKYDGPYPYVDGLFVRLTRNITQITVEHHKRYAGKGNYNLIKSINVWLKLATNFSVYPLRIATFLGLISSGIAFILALYFIIFNLMGGPAPTGWASLIITVMFIGGIQLFSIGIIGEYVGRLFIHNSKEPQFIIKTKKGF